MRRSFSAFAAVLMVVVVASVRAGAADPAPAPAKAAFERLKSLAGEWKAEVGDEAMRVLYKITSGGSVVQETLFPGTPHEMITMYHLDGDDLRLTHYCAAGNQPRLKLDPKASTAETLVFAFEGGTNLDPAKDTHMHSGRLTFKDARHIEAEWDGYSGGQKAGTHKFVLTRE